MSSQDKFSPQGLTTEGNRSKGERDGDLFHYSTLPQIFLVHWTKVSSSHLSRSRVGFPKRSGSVLPRYHQRCGRLTQLLGWTAPTHSSIGALKASSQEAVSILGRQKIGLCVAPCLLFLEDTSRRPCSVWTTWMPSLPAFIQCLIHSVIPHLVNAQRMPEPLPRVRVDAPRKHVM